MGEHLREQVSSHYVHESAMQRGCDAILGRMVYVVGEGRKTAASIIIIMMPPSTHRSKEFLFLDTSTQEDVMDILSIVWTVIVLWLVLAGLAILLPNNEVGRTGRVGKRLMEDALKAFNDAAETASQNLQQNSNSSATSN